MKLFNFLNHQESKRGKKLKDTGDFHLITSVIYPLGVTLWYYGAEGDKITAFRTRDGRCWTSLCGRGVLDYDGSRY